MSAPTAITIICTACWTSAVRLLAKKVCRLDSSPWTAWRAKTDLNFFRRMPPAPRILIVSSPDKVSTKTECLFAPSSKEVSAIFFKRGWMYKVTSTKMAIPTKTGITIHPPIMSIKIRKIIAKGISMMATSVAEVKNSRICSYSLRVLAIVPTDPFFDLNCKSMIFANKRSAIAVSASMPAAPMNFERATFTA